MAYITLEELKKILPGILSDWIDGDDESWEWIFQEIEQKCHVGKKKKDKKKWIFENLLAEFDVYKKSTDKLQHENIQHGLSIKDIQAEIRRLRDDVKAAKSMAQTAKQRTEVDYSKYSGKSVEKVCSTCKHAVPMDAAHECPYLNDCCTNNMSHWEAKDE
jgi:hypothetical protein